MSRLTRDGTAEPVSRDQILRHERGQGNIPFSCSADHVQDWQPYPLDPYSCEMCDHTYIHYITVVVHKEGIHYPGGGNEDVLTIILPVQSENGNDSRPRCT